MQPPYGLAVAISDRQDGSFEQQEVSGRDVVASAKIIAVQRKRWIRRRWGWTWEGGPPRHRQQKPGNKISTPAGQMVVALRKRWTGMGRWGLRAIKSATRNGGGQNSGHRHLIEES